jgi:hypothetical protein
MKGLAIAISLAALAALAAWGVTAAEGAALPMILNDHPDGREATPAAAAGEDSKAADSSDNGAQEEDDEAPPAFVLPGMLPQGEDLLRMACWAAGKAEEAGPQMDPSAVLDQVIENMAKTEELLSGKGEAGQEAVQSETKVIEDLSALVEYVKQKQQKQQKQQQKKQQQSQGDSQKSGQSQPKPGSGQGEPKKGKNPAQKEQATHGQANENGVKGDNPDVSAERWGELLPNAPQETKQAMGEMILPQYRELLNRYFYALSQHKEEKGSDQ